MPDSAKKKRVFLLGNPDKSEARAAMRDLRSFAAPHCEIVGAELGRNARAAVDAGADRLIVIGGDGTLIGAARSLITDQIPLIGVNVGKLGFLTEFSVDELKDNFDRVISDDTLISRRAMLQVTIAQDGGTPLTHLAVNDCVIQAGPPFRIINMGVSINDERLADVTGDGMIVCTSSGSTAHNLSAGGPLMQPGADAVVLTPLCAHSLTHKPLVIEREASISILARTVNEGTTVIIDGQASSPLKQNDRVIIQRFSADLEMVRNPLYARWHKLVNKLHWGWAPSYE